MSDVFGASAGSNGPELLNGLVKALHAVAEESAKLRASMTGDLQAIANIIQSINTAVGGGFAKGGNKAAMNVSELWDNKRYEKTINEGMNNIQKKLTKSIGNMVVDLYNQGFVSGNKKILESIQSGSGASSVTAQKAMTSVIGNKVTNLMSNMKKSPAMAFLYGDDPINKAIINSVAAVSDQAGMDARFVFQQYSNSFGTLVDNIKNMTTGMQKLPPSNETRKWVEKLGLITQSGKLNTAVLLGLGKQAYADTGRVAMTDQDFKKQIIAIAEKSTIGMSAKDADIYATMSGLSYAGQKAPGIHGFDMTDEQMKAGAEAKRKNEYATAGVMELKSRYATVAKDIEAMDVRPKGFKQLFADTDALGYRLITVSYMASKVSTQLNLLIMNATKVSTEYGLALSKVQGLLEGSFGDTEKEIKSLEEGIWRLAGTTGESFSSLAQGAYDVVSAFPEAENKMKLLEVSAKLARAGVSDSSSALKAIIPLAKTYNELSTSSIENMADMAAQTVKIGVIELPELTAGMQKVSIAAKSAGLSMAEAFSAVGSTANVAGTPANAATQIRALLNSLMSPNQALSGLFGELGVRNWDQLIKQSGSFIGALNKINSFDENIITKAIPESRAIQAFRALINEQQQFNTMLKANVESIGELEEMLAKAQLGAGYWATEMQKSNNMMAHAMKQMGDGMIPTLSVLQSVVASTALAFSKLDSSVFLVTAGVAALVVAVTGFGAGMAQLIGSIGSILRVSPAVMLLGFGKVLLVITAIVAAITMMAKAYGEATRVMKIHAYEYASIFYKGDQNTVARNGTRPLDFVNPLTGTNAINVNKVSNLPYSDSYFKEYVGTALAMQKSYNSFYEPHQQKLALDERNIFQGLELAFYEISGGSRAAMINLEAMNEAIGRLVGTLDRVPDDPFMVVKKMNDAGKANREQASKEWTDTIAKMRISWLALQQKNKDAKAGMIGDFNFEQEANSLWEGFYQQGREYSAKSGEEYKKVLEDITKAVGNHGVAIVMAVQESLSDSKAMSSALDPWMEIIGPSTAVRDRMSELSNALKDLAKAGSSANVVAGKIIAEYKELESIKNIERYSGDRDEALKARKARFDYRTQFATGNELDISRLAIAGTVAGLSVPSDWMSLSNKESDTSATIQGLKNFIKSMNTGQTRYNPATGVYGGEKEGANTYVPIAQKMLNVAMEESRMAKDALINYGVIIPNYMKQYAGMVVREGIGEKRDPGWIKKQLGLNVSNGYLERWASGAQGRANREREMQATLSYSSGFSNQVYELQFAIEKLQSDAVDPLYVGMADLIDSTIKLKESQLQAIGNNERYSVKTGDDVLAALLKGENPDGSANNSLQNVFSGFTSVSSSLATSGVVASAGAGIGGDILGGIFGALSGAVSGLGSVFMSLLSASAPLVALFSIGAIVMKGIMQVLEPVVSSVLQPLVGVFIVIGRLIGNLLAPLFQAFAPIIEVLITMFVRAYNFMLPVFEFFLDIFSTLSQVLSAVGLLILGVATPFVAVIELVSNALIGLANAMIGVINKLIVGKKNDLDKIDKVTFVADMSDLMSILSDNVNNGENPFATKTLTAIDVAGVTAAGDTENQQSGGFGGAATVTQAPDQYFNTYVYINGVDAVAAGDGKVVSIDYIVDQVQVALRESGGLMAQA